MVRAGAQARAAQHGLAPGFPDTSPRDKCVADDEACDPGQGAGFYVNATQAPWAPHFGMRGYVTEDFPSPVFDSLAQNPERQGIAGHSMGGHGAFHTESLNA